MKTKLLLISAGMMTSLFLGSCDSQQAKKPVEIKKETPKKTEKSNFKWNVDRFDDLKVIKYQVPSFEKLSLSQKSLVYYLSQAALSGRDIIYDQNYRHNLKIRKTLETIIEKFAGNKTTDDWANFMIYTKKVWFANGIHHHYSSEKFEAKFSKGFFKEAIKVVGSNHEELYKELEPIIFDNNIDNKRVNQADGADIVLESANNYYGSDVTDAEATAYYKKQKAEAGETKTPISYGLNTTLVKENGALVEKVWKLDGKYGPAIEKIIYWLEKAVTVAENEKQANALKLLIEYYRTGDLKTWDDYNIAWVSATEGDIDYIHGFIEVYGDSKGYKAAYESIVQITDFEASAAMKVLSDNVQWFEDNSSIMEEHKKKNVVGVTYKVVETAMESGDASPSTPIGVNLPNANWIRENHGSKSVSLGNIVYAYSQSKGSGQLNEFCLSEAEIKRAKAHAKRASKLHTALHEVVGHASGKINENIGTPKETLKKYASALEEGRADLVALYYLLDQKMVDLGLMESLEVGKAEYDSYIRNGMMTQLQRLKVGDHIEEAHMRNRQMVASWAFEKGKAENVIEIVKKDNKTFFKINDYNKLRDLFGQLLKEIQRIKSEGDYEAGKNLIENYGVKVDPVLHQEVLDRVSKLNIAPYGGFVNPEYTVIKNDAGEITDVKLNYVDSFEKQMMNYAKNYSFLK
ncbi:MAG: dipeptidyl-peptidase 3 family protein [Flavobacteriales bacterium]